MYRIMKHDTNVYALAKQTLFDMGSMFKYFISVCTDSNVKQEN